MKYLSQVFDSQMFELREATVGFVQHCIYEKGGRRK
jgi:hypothetical protein